MAKKEGNETPLMQQYYATKAKYPDAILLYRMGDFYETFGADAITTSRILGITLTKRSSGSPGTVELAGFPYHAIDTYLPKLVRAGQRVAICEQLEDPKKTKFLVKRSNWSLPELVTANIPPTRKVTSSWPRSISTKPKPDYLYWICPQVNF